MFHLLNRVYHEHIIRDAVASGIAATLIAVGGTAGVALADEADDAATSTFDTGSTERAADADAVIRNTPAATKQEAQENLDTAKSNAEAAKSADAAAEDKMNEAKTNLDEASGKLDAAKESESAAKDALDKANENADTAKDIQSQTSSGLDAAQKKYQSEYDKAVESHGGVPSQEINGTKDALDKATSDAQQAQSDADTSKDALDKATQDNDNAQAEYDDIKTQYDQAQNEYREAYSAARDAQAKYDAAKQAYDDAAANYSEEDLTQLKDACDTAKAALDKANTAIKRYELDIKESQLLLHENENYANKAKQAYDDAESKRTVTQDDIARLTQEANAAAENLTKAQQAMNDAKTRLDKASSDCSDSNPAWVKAKNDLDAANQAYLDAQNKLTDARKALDEAKKNNSGSYNASALDFIKDNIDNDTNKDSTSYASLQKSLDNARAGGEYLKDYVKFGGKGDSTHLDNVKLSLQFIRECNSIRKSLGLSELKITNDLMAYAEYDIDWSSTHIEHARVFGTAENLCWGYGTQAYVPGGTARNPFSGWYDSEKKTYDDWVAKNPSKAIVWKDFNSLYYWSVGDGKDIYYSVGHYLNIINPFYATTGFAINTNGTYRTAFAQEFSGNSYGTSYTVDEYEKLLDNYIAKHSVTSDDVVKAQADYDAAQAASDKARDAYQAADDAKKSLESQLKNDLNAAQAANDKAQADYQAAVASNDSAKSSLRQAQDAYDSESAQVDPLKKAYERYQNDVDSFTQKIEDLNSKLAQAQADLSGATERYDGANQAYQNALSAYDNVMAQKPILDEASANLDAAKQKLDGASNVVTRLSGRLITAQENKANASKALKSAQDAYNESSMRLNAANDALNEAQKAYDDVAQRYDESRKVLASYEKTLAQADENLKSAQDAYDKATAAYGHAETSVKSAEEAYTEAVDNRKQAENSLESAQDALDKASAAHEKAHQDYIDALAVLSYASADFDRFRDASLVERLAGSAYSGSAGTATAIAMESFAGESCDTVFIARNDDYHDALAGAGYAGALGAPILLTDTASLSRSTVDAIAALGAKNAVILGGEKAVSEGVANDLEALGLSVKRVGGQDVYGTSMAIARELIATGKASTDYAVAVNPTTFADAVSISGWAYKNCVPVMLQTWGDSAADRGYDAEAMSILAGREVIVCGGTLAVSDESLGGLTVKRLGGASIYDTSLAIANWEISEGGMSASDVTVASAIPDYSGVDALAASALAGRSGGVTLLAQSNDDFDWYDGGAMALGFVEEHASEIEKVHILGGDIASTPSFYDAIRKILGKGVRGEA